MKVKLDETTNYLADIMDLKMQVKASYLFWKLGLGLAENNDSANEFYEFCNNFCYAWDRYLKRILPLLEEFNQKENTRHIYAEALYRQYDKYAEELENMYIPRFLSSSFQQFQDSIYMRKEYFRLNSNNKLMPIIENFSDESEYNFWQQLYAMSKKMFKTTQYDEFEQSFQVE